MSRYDDEIDDHMRRNENPGTSNQPKPMTADDAAREAKEGAYLLVYGEEKPTLSHVQHLIDRAIEAVRRDENEACVGMLRALVGSGEAFDCRELYALIGKMESRARISKEEE